MLDEKGRILSVAPRERLDAHKLIEDYMIAANVAAAKALEAKKAPVMYRVHEPPSREKLVALKDYLKTFDVEFALGQVVRPETFNRIIERLGEADFRPQVMEQILRTQTQAYYGPQNHGHFGLALGSYAHFTSPIRRYADLVVHRALVRAYRLGEGGLTDEEAAAMEVIGELISNLERRAMVAERETMDRYVAAFLADQVGALVKCRITGVQPFGFFATVEELGGDGLVPAATLGQRIFPLRRGQPEPDRRGERRDLCARPAADPAAGRGQSGDRRASLRAARCGARGGADAGGAAGQAAAWQARAPGKHPPPGKAALTYCPILVDRPLPSGGRGSNMVNNSFGGRHESPARRPARPAFARRRGAAARAGHMHRQLHGDAGRHALFDRAPVSVECRRDRAGQPDRGYPDHRSRAAADRAGTQRVSSRFSPRGEGRAVAAGPHAAVG